MSAYARPGLFSLPLPDPTASEQLRQVQFSPCDSPRDVRGVFSAPAGVPPPPKLALGPPNPSTDVGAPTCSGDVVIAVEGATYDPALLVQALTCGLGHTEEKGQCSSRSKLFCRRVAAQSLLRPDAYYQGGATTDKAVQFLLSIHLGGRQYAAARTLLGLIQLRDDLVRELQERTASSKLKKSQASCVEMRCGDGMSTHLDYCTGDHYADDNNSDLKDVAIIPVFPTKGGHTVCSGSSAQGFGHLQAQLTSYCPAVEGWLQHVVRAIPPWESPSLSRFLWEPLGAGRDCADGGVCPHNRTIASSWAPLSQRCTKGNCTLDSIEELSDF